MNALFLGTGAATACPLPFCRCAACEYARKHGGRDFRRRSSVLINDDLLIDMGPDLTAAAFDFNVDLTKIKYVLQTHSHSDHFDAGHMITRIPDYAGENIARIELRASRECVAHMSEKLAREEGGATLLEAEWLEKLNTGVAFVKHGDVFSLGKYEIIAVESAHDISDGSLMYIIRDGGRAFFYAVDTVAFTPRALELLSGLDFQINAMAIDQCYGPYAEGGGHLCAREVAELISVISIERAYATHISHEGTPPHAELEKWTRARGYEVAYDGLSITI